MQRCAEHSMYKGASNNMPAYGKLMCWQGLNSLVQETACMTSVEHRHTFHDVHTMQ